MVLIDTHAHIQEDAFEPDRQETLARAHQEGVSRIVVVGFTLDSSRRAVELAEQRKDVFAVVGIQPNYVAEARSGDWDEILKLARSTRTVGIGETGLDLYWKAAPIELQADHFQRHIALARELDLPFVVHSRDAEKETVAELEKAARLGPLRGVMHSFSGSLETARACWELGMYISFAGMVTFKNNHALRAVAAAVPLAQILIETDCPYLAPTPYRGKRNEPGYVRYTAECLAEVRGMTTEEFATLTTANAERLFPFDRTRNT